MSAVDLGATAVKAALAKAGVDAKLVQEVFLPALRNASAGGA